MRTATEHKIVYLATPKGPESFTLNGVWLKPVGDAAPKRRRRRASAASEITEVEEPVEGDEGAEPVFSDKPKRAARMGRPKGSKNKPKRKTGQASIGD